MGAAVVTRVKRRAVGAHYGTAQWLRQRLTAVIMAAYTILAIAALLIIRPDNHAAWQALFAPGWVRVVTLLFFLSLCYHAWVGMRDILMDYARPTGQR